MRYVAIDEALRFEHHIERVHIFHEMVPTPLLATYDVLTSRDAGRAALDEAVAQLGHRLSDTRGRLTVSTKLIDGSVREELPKLGATLPPSHTNFVFADFPRPGVELYEQLLRKGVIVRPFAGQGFPNSLRISVGTPAENERCVKALKEIPT